MQSLPELDFLGVISADPLVVDRLRTPGRVLVRTPFVYPDRGPVVITMASDGEHVRLSEEGGLLRFLEAQGLDVALDTVISKTVFHALSETSGAGMGAGQVHMDTTPENVAGDLWRFVQIIIEVIGLRHSKYKDAVVKLSLATEHLQPPDWG